MNHEKVREMSVHGVCGLPCVCFSAADLGALAYRSRKLGCGLDGTKLEIVCSIEGFSENRGYSTPVLNKKAVGNSHTAVTLLKRQCPNEITLSSSGTVQAAKARHGTSTAALSLVPPRHVVKVVLLQQRNSPFGEWGEGPDTMCGEART